MPGPFDQALADLAAPEPTHDFSQALADISAPEPEPHYQPVAPGLGEAFLSSGRFLGKGVIGVPAMLEAAVRRFVGPTPQASDPTPLGTYMTLDQRQKTADEAAASYDRRPGIPGYLQRSAEGAVQSLPMMAPSLAAGAATKVSALATPMAQALQRLFVSSVGSGATNTVQEMHQDPRLEHLPYAVGQGIIEGVMERLGGPTGVESMLRDPTGRQRVRDAFLEVLKETGHEMPQEGLTSGLQEGLKQAEQGQYSPGDIIDQTIEGGLSGGMMAGTTNSPHALDSVAHAAAQRAAPALLAARMATAQPQMPGGVVPQMEMNGQGNQGIPTQELINRTLATEQARSGLPQDFTPDQRSVVPDTGGGFNETQPNGMTAQDSAAQIAQVFASLHPDVQQHIGQSIANLFQPQPTEASTTPNPNELTSAAVGRLPVLRSYVHTPGPVDFTVVNRVANPR